MTKPFMDRDSSKLLVFKLSTSTKFKSQSVELISDLNHRILRDSRKKENKTKFNKHDIKRVGKTAIRLLIVGKLYPSKRPLLKS